MKFSTLLACGPWVKAGLLTSLLGFLAACSYTTSKDLPPPAPVLCVLPATISYQTNVLPILKANCYSCHDAAHYQDSPPNGSGSTLNMENFNQLRDYSLVANGHNGTSVLVGSVRGDVNFVGMPFGKAKLEPCEIAILEAWSAAGAPAK